MSVPEKDFAERSRSIFEQLRAQTESAHADVDTDEAPADTPAEAGDADVVSDDAGAPVDAELEEAPAATWVDDRGTDDEIEAPDVTEREHEPAAALEPVREPVLEDAPDMVEEAVRPEDVAPEEDDAHFEAPSSDDVDPVDVVPALEDAEHRPEPEPIAAYEDVPAAHAVIVEPEVEEGESPPPLPVEPESPSVEPEAAVSAPPAEAPLPDPQRFARPLPRVLAIANQKGGVGKTTTTVNLGASLAVLGYRVLVIDLDPQGNATTGLGINSRNLESSIYDVILHDTPLDDCVEPTSLRNLFVAPATIDLAGAEIELVPAFSREQRLKRALEEVKDDYEFVLIDCPPSLGLLTVNALSAASEVVVPIQCEYYALEGLGQLLRNINLVQANLNPTLELSAIVLTMYDARTKLAEQVADEVRQHFGDRVCRNVVPRTVRLSEAPSFGQPIIVFDPSSRGALAYRELAREVSGGPPQRTG